MVLFFQLYAAHLIADFVLQPDWIARNKRNPSALGAHAAIHVGVALAAVNVRLSVPALSAILLLALVHCGIDYLKARFSDNGWVAFSIDQATHLIVVAAAAAWVSAPSARAGLAPFLRIAEYGDAYLYLSGYVSVVFGGGLFVQKVTQSFLENIDPQLADHKPGLPKAGRYIGWMERFLILTFVLAGHGEAIGFLLAAKALVRFPEIQEDTKGHFAEYFLIGTLTSVGLALLGGIVMMKLAPLIP